MVIVCWNDTLWSGEAYMKYALLSAGSKKEKTLLRPDIVVLYMSCRRILLVDLSDTYIRFVIVETNYY